MNLPIDHRLDQPVVSIDDLLLLVHLDRANLDDFEGQFFNFFGLAVGTLVPFQV